MVSPAQCVSFPVSALHVLGAPSGPGSGGGNSSAKYSSLFSGVGTMGAKVNLSLLFRRVRVQREVARGDVVQHLWRALV